MASFYAEFEVAGHSYPVRLCEFSFTQATNERGRVAAKVRHGLLHLTLDVPEGDQLLSWASAVKKPLAGHVTFFETNRLTARETVGFAAGECVGYEETFVSGDGGNGAYVCRLTIAAPKLELLPGGPARAFVPAAARDYATAAAEVAAQNPVVASTDSPAGMNATKANDNPLANTPNYSTVSMDPDYVGEETGAVWGTKVKYLSASEREGYKLLIGEDGLVYDANKALFDTTKAGTVTGKGKAIFVMSEAGDIYASSEHQAGLFHHSSFLSGGPVAAAGEVEVIAGLVKTVSNRSGHYTPDQSYTQQFVEQLWRKGAKGTDKIEVVDFEH